MTEADYQKFFDFIKQDKNSWSSKLFYLVEKHFDKFLKQISTNKLPIKINRSESLVRFYHNMMTTINLAGVDKNPYIDISLTKKKGVKVKLKRNSITVLIEFMLFTGNLILGEKKFKISIDQLLKEAERGKKFYRSQKKTVKEENRAIVEIQKKLEEQFGRGHKSSLRKAVEVYSQRNNLKWNEKTLKNRTESIRQRPPK